MGWKITGVIVWLAAIVLATLVAVVDLGETRTFDLSGIRAEQVIAGTNSYAKPDFKASSPVAFVTRHYDLLMVGVKNDSMGILTYLGVADGEYYTTTERFPSGALQQVKEVKVDGKMLIITLGKDVVLSVFLSAVLCVVFFLIGGYFFWRD